MGISSCISWAVNGDHASGKPGSKVIQGRLGHAQRRAGQRQGQDRHDGRAIQGSVMDVHPGIVARNGAPEGQHPMRRHEDILPHEAAASRAAQARDVPVILDLDITSRDEALALVLCLALIVLNGRPENQPVGMLTARPKRPEPTETKPISDSFRRPSWGKDGCNEGIGMRTIRLFLRLHGEQGH